MANKMRHLILATVLICALHMAITEAELCNIQNFYQVCEKTTTSYTPVRFGDRSSRKRRHFFFGDLLEKIKHRLGLSETTMETFKCPSIRPTDHCLDLLRDHSIVCYPCCNQPTPVIQHCDTFPGSLMVSKNIVPGDGRAGIASANVPGAPPVGQEVYVRESFRNLVHIPPGNRLLE